MRSKRHLTVLVCGGRDFADQDWIFERLDEYQAHYGRFRKIIHGKARGADTIADAWAKQRGIPVQGFTAYWQIEGRAAGPIRNRRMLQMGKPDLVIAFPGGPGTADMMRQARAAGVPVIDVRREPWPELHL